MMLSSVLMICIDRNLPVASSTLMERLQFISNNMRDVYFGDDHIVSFSKHLKITGQDIAKEFLKWNIVYTTPQKDSNFTIKTKLEEVTFLKRRFYKNSQGVYVALLEPKVIFETLLWHRQQDVDQIECINAVVQSMRDEIFLYGIPAHRFFETFLDYVYDQLQYAKPRYDYEQRGLDICIYSTKTPSYFFTEWKEFYSRMPPQKYEKLCQYMARSPSFQL